jgi:hypothetical protein
VSLSCTTAFPHDSNQQLLRVDQPQAEDWRPCSGEGCHPPVPDQESVPPWAAHADEIAMILPVKGRALKQRSARLCVATWSESHTADDHSRAFALQYGCTCLQSRAQGVKARHSQSYRASKNLWSLRVRRCDVELLLADVCIATVGVKRAAKRTLRRVHPPCQVPALPTLPTQPSCVHGMIVAILCPP